MSRSSILNVWGRALESNLCSRNTHVGELELQLSLQLSLKSSEFDAAAVDLFSTEGRLSFEEDAVGLIRKHAQSEGL